MNLVSAKRNDLLVLELYPLHGQEIQQGDNVRNRLGLINRGMAMPGVVYRVLGAKTTMSRIGTMVNGINLDLLVQGKQVDGLHDKN